MTEPARLSLFDEMDAAADALRKDNPNLHDALGDELQLLFMGIQQRRMPHLSGDERIELFEMWLTEYAAKCKREREAAIAGIIATIDAYARANGPRAKFKCPCGEELDNPGDPAVMAVHQPHCLAAKQRS